MTWRSGWLAFDAQPVTAAGESYRVTDYWLEQPTGNRCGRPGRWARQAFRSRMKRWLALHGR